MKNLNKILIIALVLVIAASMTAFAITAKNPVKTAEILTDKPTKEIAYDEILKNKKAFLDEKVKEGLITQEEANEIFSKMEEMQKYCIENDGNYGIMRNKFGNGQGFKMGNGFGGGRGCKGSW